MYYREEQSPAKEAGKSDRGQIWKQRQSCPLLTLTSQVGGTVLWLFSFWNRGLEESPVYCM